ncbi:hypothetical protein DNU06_17430 [Putridiphycobacter roseus]|uniref:Uncharacterized protein n=2 Tax=Putridiphycobacter roseus TaxID=2219161 RepID=A0A2W1N8J7_9FLAO|nr:hypothetical protein DNU06_17430 [Putridiphycobacter roseus]
MTAEDSLLNQQARWIEFDCYEDTSSYRVFRKFSNGQESVLIYNLAEKDSIVMYYYSGQIASIANYFGCQEDTIWTTSFTEIIMGGNAPIPIVEVGTRMIKENYYVTIDSIDYFYSTSYNIGFSPVYEITVYSEEGKVLERKTRGRSRFVDFKKTARTKYLKP